MTNSAVYPIRRRHWLPGLQEFLLLGDAAHPEAGEFGGVLLERRRCWNAGSAQRGCRRGKEVGGRAVAVSWTLAGSVCGAGLSARPGTRVLAG